MKGQSKTGSLKRSMRTYTFGVLLLLVLVTLSIWILNMDSISGKEKSPSLEEWLKGTGPKTPQEALKTFHLEPGFRLELVAAEPEVVDPIDMAWDEYGRLYVAEYRDYPYGTEQGKLPSSRIRLLEDKDGDGYYEKSIIFADKLHWSSSVIPWRGGIYVAAPPEILYLKDTTGDGKADILKTVFTGFGSGSGEDIMNNLKLGMDGWIYGATSYNNGEVNTASQSLENSISVRGRDFRFHPDSLFFEAVSGGGGDFGNTFDDWGNRFVTQPGGSPLIHVVFSESHFAQNPYFVPNRVSQKIADLPDRRVFQISPPERWRVSRQQFWDRYVNTSHDMRAERFSETELAIEGYATGMAGGTIFRGSAYPEQYKGTAFIAEPAGNLVINLVLQPEGVTFTAPRLHNEKREFLASTDNWFRPVNFANGPDGHLYILDMYREYIEDPSAIPDEILQHLDMKSGSDHGRIWRIVSTEEKNRTVPYFSKTEDLVEAIGSADSWVRETGQRLMIERQDRSAIPQLKQLAGSSSALPAARVHALWVLSTLRGLDERIILETLKDSHPRVRENAVKLTETFQPIKQSLWDAVADLTDDPDDRVRFQATLSLGSWQHPKAVQALAEIAVRNLDDWTRNAILTAVPANLSNLFTVLAYDDFGDSPFMAELLTIIGAMNDPAQTFFAMKQIGIKGGEESMLDNLRMMGGLAKGTSKSNVSLSSMVQQMPSAEQELYERILDHSEQVALNQDLANDMRIDAIQLIGYAGDSRTSSLIQLLKPSQPDAVQKAVIYTLVGQGGEKVGEALVSAWHTAGPAIRKELLQMLFRRDEYAEALLSALEQKTIGISAIPADQRQLLINNADKGISSRAMELFAESAGNRKEIINRYQQALLDVKGDAVRGKIVFQNSCAICHVFAGNGNEVGPNLNQMRRKPTESLLVDILDPNRIVSPNYVTYTISTLRGETFSGVIAQETDTSITLKTPGGEERQLLRSTIKSLSSQQRSLMPEGLEVGISENEMADLLEFLMKSS